MLCLQAAPSQKLQQDFYFYFFIFPLLSRQLGPSHYFAQTQCFRAKVVDEGRLRMTDDEVVLVLVQIQLYYG